MILSRNNQVHRFLNRYGVSFPSNNLCGLFWQTVGMVFLLTLAGVAIGVYFIGAWQAIVGFPMTGPMAVFTVLSLVGGGLGIIALSALFSDTGTARKWANNVGEAVDGIKEQYCPIISWKD